MNTYWTPPPLPLPVPVCLEIFSISEVLFDVSIYILICNKNPQSFNVLFKVVRWNRKTFLFSFCFLFLLRFPTLVGNLSVFVLSFLIILYSLFFIFLLSFPHHSPLITSSIFNRLTSNFQQMFRMTRLLLLLNFNEIGQGVGTGRGLQIWYSL